LRPRLATGLPLHRGPGFGVLSAGPPDGISAWTEKGEAGPGARLSKCARLRGSYQVPSLLQAPLPAGEQVRVVVPFVFLVITNV
jgi:hypothetical protein